MKRARKNVCICCLILFVSAFVCLITAKGELAGDIDGNGVVDRDDAALVFDYVSGYGYLSFEQLDLADVDGDGGVTIADVSLIFQKASGRLEDIPFIPEANEAFTLFSLPNKLEYSEGEELDITGLSVGMRCFNGDETYFDDYTYTGYDAEPGVKIVTVEHDGLKASFSVVVYPAETSRLEILSEPIKRIYLEGEELDLTGLSVAEIGSDGNSRIIDSYTVDGFESVSGRYVITVKYRMKTASFIVVVK